MTHVGYLIAGWGIALGSIALYAAGLMRRGRSLAASVPEQQQRWMNADAGLDVNVDATEAIGE